MGLTVIARTFFAEGQHQVFVFLLYEPQTERKRICYSLQIAAGQFPNEIAKPLFADRSNLFQKNKRRDVQSRFCSYRC